MFIICAKIHFGCYHRIAVRKWSDKAIGVEKVGKLCNVEIGDYLLSCNNFWWLRFLYGQEEFKLCRQLVFWIKAIREVDSADPAIGVDLNA